MEISFYEEFPTQKNLKKLKLVKFKTKLFVAARSIKDFQKYEKQIKKIKKNTKIAYWPIVKNSYYISPFSNTNDLIELFKELNSIKNPLLIDIEIPLKRSIIIKNLNLVKNNKKIIKEFLAKNDKRITTPTQIFISNKLMQTIGLDYKGKHQKNPMVYTSMLNSLLIRKTKKNLVKLKNKEEYTIGLGTIAIGIKGNEPILSPENLEKDLSFMKKSGFNKVIIFRLGGLNKKYINVINKFIK